MQLLLSLTRATPTALKSYEAGHVAPRTAILRGITYAQEPLTRKLHQSKDLTRTMISLYVVIDGSPAFWGFRSQLCKANGRAVGDRTEHISFCYD
jgi:hypothetical protein